METNEKIRKLEERFSKANEKLKTIFRKMSEGRLYKMEVEHLADMNKFLYSEYQELRELNKEYKMLKGQDSQNYLEYFRHYDLVSDFALEIMIQTPEAKAIVGGSELN